MPTITRGAKVSKQARAKALLETGLKPDEIFVWLVDRWRNGKMTDAECVEFRLALQRFAKPAMKAVEQKLSADTKMAAKVTIGGDALVQKMVG